MRIREDEVPYDQPRDGDGGRDAVLNDDADLIDGQTEPFIEGDPSLWADLHEEEQQAYQKTEQQSGQDSLRRDLDSSRSP